MRTLLVMALLLTLSGCTRWALDRHLNSAYEAYDKGNCEAVMLELSQAERYSRSRRYIQPEISLLRGQCLERQSLFVDAAQTYEFIISRYPASEYAFRAQARLQTLSELGHKVSTPAASTPHTAL
ncbi:tetratricopeptide repeat protein [Pseudomonas sp. EL_65y_Pfl2_R95]|uniref:tetratricopeptide repeat protein n=1 Tax=Pseudomonas sp. EL_65y_Pfl2_R95 TaxID=3088698 RepID=UPI0030DDD1B9